MSLLFYTGKNANSISAFSYELPKTCVATNGGAFFGARFRLGLRTFLFAKTASHNNRAMKKFGCLRFC